MPPTFRVASYNVENLFTRAKALNLRDGSVGDEVLDQIAELQKLLRRPTYTAAVKAQILELYEGLKGYIEIREDRGKLFKRQGFAIVGVQADKPGDWDGAIEHKRAKFSDMARDNTAKVIKAVKADVVCVVEAENRDVLTRFNAEFLNYKFKYNLLIDGNDQRGIDVGVWSKHPLGTIKTHIYDTPPNSSSRTFSRDCLEVEILLPGGQPLCLLCNHLKSRGYGDAVEGDERRKRQAERVAEILGDYDLTTDWVIVAGDLNDTPTRAPLQPLLTVNNLFDALELQFPADAQKRWTYFYGGQFNQIDYLLVSKALKDRFRKAGAERRGIYNLSTLTGGEEGEYDTVTHWTNAASDHAAIWADFEA